MAFPVSLREKERGYSRRIVGSSVEGPSLFALTPVQRVGKIWLKRDDIFETCGVNGGKARACFALAQTASGGLVTASGRRSPQGVIVAAIARRLGLASRVHTALGGLTPELEEACLFGAEIIFHRPGYNSVIIRRALDDAAMTGWTIIPFGMECAEAVELTARQVINLPAAAGRVVVPVGSGVTLAGVLVGLAQMGRRLPVLGVIVGADPTRRLEVWAPPGWRDMVELTQSTLAYQRTPSETLLGRIALDPLYEAKCLSFLQTDDCLWVVGHRRTLPVCSKSVPGPLSKNGGEPIDVVTQGRAAESRRSCTQTSARRNTP
jgi:hypothetical protein